MTKPNATKAKTITKLRLVPSMLKRDAIPTNVKTAAATQTIRKPIEERIVRNIVETPFKFTV